MHWDVPTSTVGILIVQDKVGETETELKGLVRAMSCGLAFPTPSSSVELPGIQKFSIQTWVFGSL